MCSNSLPRNNPDTDSGATRSTARTLPRLSSWSSHTTSLRSGMAGTNDVKMRDAVSLTSVSAVDRLGARRRRLRVTR